MLPFRNFLACCALAGFCFFQSPARAADLRIVGDPQRVAGGAWRITWESEPGREYILQRWNGDDLGTARVPRWVEVSRVTAAEGLTSAEDASAVGIDQRFYRIVEGESGQSEIAIVRSPELTGEGWRITWTAEPGSTYALERWTSDALGIAGVPPWTEVARVTASGAETSATDPGSSSTGQRFYRVTLLSDSGEDVQAPTVSAIQATETDNGQTLVLSVTALDDQGVESVTFSDGEVVLGPGIPAGGGFYEISVPHDPNREIKPYFIAKAVDAAGNAGFSPVLRYGLEEQNRFAVVDENGNPTGEYVEPNPDGSLPPFEYRPGGRNALGASRELSVKFGEGARVVVIDGKEYIEFTEAEASFGEDSPIQFLAAVNGGLAAFGIQAGDGQTLSQQAATPKRLPVGPLSMEDLALAFDHDPEVGIPVTFYGHFPMLWKGGILEDYGIRAPRFGFIGPDLPLPEVSGDYPDYALNFLRDREVRLAFYGEFTLPDQSSTPPTLRIPAAKPLWLTLSANGAISVEGSGELVFPGGPRFKAGIRLADPFYEVQIAAESLQVPLLGSLAELLPPNPAVCLPGTAGDAELDLASECLRAFARACVNFSASARAAGPSDSTSSPSAPPDEFSTLTSLLEAWIYSAVTPAAQALPLTELRDLLRQIGQASAGSRNIGSVLRFELALLRAREALENGAFQESAEARAELEQAIAEAEAAARARAQEPDAVRSLSELREVIGMLVSISEIRQQLGLPEGDFFEATVPALLNNFASRYTSQLGVETDAFEPGSNPVIAAMNRFVVYEEISNLLGVLSDAAVLGFDEPLSAPIPEALSQLALRLYATSTAAMDEAEAGEDVPGFTYALADFLDLLAMRDLGIFPLHSALEVIPPTTDAGVAAAGRLNALLLLDLEKPRSERSFVHMADEIRRLLKILRTVPASVTFASPPIERVYAFMEEALGASFTLVGGNSNVAELVELLEGGTLHARLRRQFQFESGTSWESERLGVVAARLASEARAQQAWSELHRGAEFLIEQADLLEEESAGTEAARLSLRLAYLQQAGTLLEAAREVAVTIWEEEASRRADSPLLLADLFLPGDIMVEHVAGSAWYNRKTSLFGGAFKGRVRLPKFDGTFEILQASFNSGGAFDLSCFGTVSLPGGQLTIPARFPLRVGFNAPNDVYFSGEGQVSLDNGLSFAAHLILDDPLYGFGLEARGLRFDLANELTLLRPTLEEGALGNLSDQLRVAFLDYFTGMNSTLESLVGRSTDLPVIDFGAVGEPPEFEAPQVTLPFAQLNAWANAVLLDVERGANAAYAGTLGAVRESLEHLNDQAREARDTLDTEIRTLENQLQRTTIRRRAARAFEKGAEQAFFGNDAGIAEARDAAEEGLKEELVLHAQLLTPEVTQDPGQALRHLTVLLNLTATGQMIDADLSDMDGDGVANENDNCPSSPNAGQEDADNDGLGDGCDPEPNNAAIPEEGPCKDFFRSGTDPLLQVQQLLQCTRLNYFQKLGLDPQSGAVANSATFEAYSEEQLEEVVLLLGQLETVAQMTGIETTGLQTALVEINQRRHELLLAAYNQPETNLLRKYELARQLNQSAETAAVLDDTSIPPDSGAVRAVEVVKGLSEEELEDLNARATKRLKERRETLEKRVLRDLQADFNADVDDLLDRGEPRPFIQDLGIFIAVLFEQRGEKDEVYLEKVSSFIRRKVQRMRQRAIDPEFLNERLHEGLSMAETLVGMTDWALQHVSDDPQLFEDLQVTLENLTINFTAVAEAQKAWWLVGRYAEVLDQAYRTYGDRMTTAVQASFDQALAKTLLAANRITDAFAELLSSVDLESVVFRLPGDLVVQRVFGSVLYNRETEVLSGRFGGRIEFPESQAFFEIKDAAIASDGSFSINAETGGPLPFGSGVSVNASVLASGAIGGEFSFLGSGEMQVDSDGSLQTFAIDLSYNTTSRVLGFNSTANDLNLRFTDDFVLYDAGLGFEISTVRPAGRLVISGSAGIAARQKPLPETALPEHFYLNVLDTAVSAELDETGFEIALERGTLTLPEMFDTGTCENLPNATGPAVILNPEQPIFVRYNADPQSIEFGGSILFSDIGFEVPGIEGFKVAVCTANLAFSSATLPVLSNVSAAIEIPLPEETAIVDIENGEWALDGFPTGTISVRNDVTLLNQGGFALKVLGEESGLCPAPTALTISNNDGQPFFRLDGGLRFSVPATVLSDDAGGEIFAAFCAGVEFGFQQFPRLEVASLAIGLDGNSNFRLGGPGGLLITGAALQAQGIQNLFNQSEQDPFVLTLSGGFQIPDGPGFELNNAQFTFIGEPLPLFSLGGASLSTGDTFEAAAGLPLTISEAGFSFKNQNLPLPDVLAPDNLVITIGASLGLPPDQPVVSGQVQGLTVTLENGVPVVHVSGIGLGIQDFEIPPLSLTGQVFVGGLGPDEDIYFAGNVGGTLQGAGVTALLAFNLQGPLGCCFSVNAGPAGIPLGPTGFLFTGAQGGVSFLNTNGDPCEFSTFINVDGATGRPAESENAAAFSMQAARPRIGQMHVMTWDQLRAQQERQRLYDLAAQAPPPAAQPALAAAAAPPTTELQALAEEPPSFPCPTGDCPPDTINILCQVHPDLDLYADRVIVKFTSLTESDLEEIGITRDWFESSGLTTAPEIAAEVAGVITAFIDSITPRPDENLTGPNGEPIGQQLNALLDEVLANVQLAFEGSLTSAIQAALGENKSVFDAILSAAYAGVRCPDATVKLTGTFSHASVSSFLSGTGGAVLSTTGSAGLVGTVNLFGIPVGFLDGFVNATDANGDPNPSMCGHVRFALGPLELGQLKALNQCEGCMTGVLGAFAGLADCLSEELFAAIIPKVAPHLAGLNRADALNTMTDEEKLAFLAEWFSLPPLPGAPECFLGLVVDSLDSLNPEFTLCGAVQPKLFGFPLTGSAIEVAAAADKTSMAGQFAFSSSLFMGTYGALFPLGDQASFGFGVAWPNPDDLIIGALTGRFSSPEAVAQYVEEGFAYMLENATYTVGFELSPFGFKGFQSGARVIMPNLTDHPEISGWIPPEERGGDLPSRLELMLAAVENEVLASPLWKGTADDIHLAFLDGDPRREAVQGLSFSKDYFPHGGVVGAARLGLPRAITDSPPTDIIEVILNPEGDLFARMGAALEYVQDYILTASEVGTLGFYVPAPNPPIFTDGQGNALPPEELLAAIMSFDPSLGISPDIYPIERAFLQGYLDGRLLGIPIARATVLGTPPTETEEGRFLISTEIPEGSWMQDFVESASMTFEVRQSPPLSIEEQFEQVAVSLEDLINSGTQQERELFLGTFADHLAASMPKVSLDLAVNNLRIPTALEPILALDGSTSARFVAYSPRFDPAAQGENPLAQAQRRGGVAMQARLRFADIITIDNAELAVLAGLPNPVTGLPPLAGLFDVPQLPIPLTSLVLQNVQLAFNSEPSAGQPFLAGSGNLTPITLAPLLEIVPLQTTENTLGAALSFIRNPDDSLAASLRINPARLAMPAFAEGLSVEIHGAAETDPFTLSTEGPWAATVSLKGGLVLRDPVGVPVLRVGTPTQTFSAALSGDGLDSASITLNLPTGIEITAFPGLSVEQVFQIGSAGANAQLTISSDGTFELAGELAGNLTLAGLPVEQVNAGASIRLTQSSLTISGAMSGGDLDGVNLGSAEASLVITKQSVSLNGSLSMAPLQFGVFRISGVDDGNISAVLDNDGLRIESGARLALQGISESLLVLQEFVIGANGDFSAAISSGEISIPNYFKVTEGSNRIERTAGVARLEMVSPRMTVFPGTPHQTLLPSPLERLLIESNGRFYYDSGTQTIGLPHAFSAGGRLEFGWEPDANAPLLAVNSSPIQFGLIDTGTSTSQTLTVRNDGGSQLLVGAASSDVETFTVSPVLLPLGPGEEGEFEIRFFATEPGTVNGSLTLTHNTATSPTSISVTGQGRAVPVYYQSADVLDFGDQPVGGGAVRQLIIANLGTAPLEVESVSVAAPFTGPTGGFTVDAGDFRRLLITFHSSAVGPATGTATLVTTHDGAAHEIQLAGTGSQQRWWIQRETGGTLLSIYGGFAVGEQGQLLSMNNVSQDGDRWTQLPSLGNIRLHRVSGNPSGFGNTYAVGRSGVVLRYESLRWTPIADPVVANGANQYLGVATYWPSHLLMLVGEGGLMVREHNFGVFSTVSSGTLEDLHDVAFDNNATFGIAVGSDGTILRSINQGASWTPVALPAGVNGINLTLRAVDINAGGAALIVGDNGTVLRSSANGLNWTKISVPTDRHLFDVRVIGSDAYAVGDSGVFLLSSNTALSWQIEGTRAGTRDLFGVYARDGKVWTVGQGGFIQHRPIDPPAGPIFGLSTGLLDFGNLPLGASSQRTAWIYNRGTDTLEISSIQGNDLFSVAQTSMSIPPGEQRLLRVYFHPQAATDTDPGNPTRVIVFNTNDPDGLHYLGVRGTSQANAWRQMPSGTDQHLREVQFPSSLIGYAIFDGGIIKTVDGGSTWTSLSIPSSGQVRALHFLTPTQGLIGGGENGLPFILRTLNGGASWTSASLQFGIEGPIVDMTVALGEDSRGYAVTGSFTTGQLTKQGQVLRTLNAGSSWTIVPGTPATFFDGAVSYSYSPFSVLVASGGTLYRSADSGSSWQTLFNLGGAFPIQSISSFGTQNTFVGGLNGLLRRSTSITANPPVFTAPAIFASGAIQDVHFASQDRGWCAVGGAGSGGVSTIYGTTDGGVTWREEFSITDGTINSIWGVSDTLAFAVGTGGRVWKFEPFSAESASIASMPGLLDFGALAMGESSQQTLQISNLGGAALVLHGLSLDNESAEAFEVTPLTQTTLAPGGSTTVTVSFQAAEPGNYTAFLTLSAEGSQNAVVTELKASVEAAPQLVVFTSEPAGLELTIDDTLYTTPVAFAVVSGASAPGEWEPGSTHTILAPDEQALGGIAYQFQGWTPARDQEFSLVALSSQPQTLMARFVRKESLAPGAAGASSFVQPLSAQAAVTPPSDVPAGPWLKLSDASLDIPGLGGINVQGAVFLSASSFSASLDSGAFRLPQDIGQPELLEITAGSWRLDFSTTPIARMRLVANSPGLELFNQIASPPSELLLDFASNGHFTASFATSDDTPLIPGVFVLGPGAVSLAADPFLSLDLSGNLKIMQKPDGTWAVNQNLAFSASEGPFTHDFSPLPPTLLDLGFTAVQTGPTSAIRLARDTTGAFSLSVSNLELDLFGRTFTSVSGLVSANGLLSVQLAPPASPFALGPMRLAPAGDSTFDWNLRTGSMAVHFAGGKLRASGVAGWPSDGIDFPAFTVDGGGDFERRIALPAFTFNGVDLAAGGDFSKNYVLLKRTDGVVSVKVRDERQLFNNDMKLAFDIASSGSVSGSFSGDFGVNTVLFGRLDFGAISLNYDSAEPDYQFQGKFRQVGNDFGIFFGSGGGKFSHLNCTGSALDDCETGLFEFTTP